MPIKIPSFLVSPGPTVPFLLEDIYLKGGLRIVKTPQDRDAIPNAARKVNMLVFVSDSNRLYRLLNDGNWEDTKLIGDISGGGGGGGGINFTTELPLSLDVDGVLRIRPERILPTGGVPGNALLLNSQNAPIWGSVAASGSGTPRTSIQHVTAQLDPGQNEDFDLTMGHVCMILKMQVDVSDVMIQAYTTAQRADANPYTFKSRPTLLIDEGITYVDEQIEYHRRFSFFANLDEPKTDKIYFRATNLSALPRTITLNITYLVLE